MAFGCGLLSGRSAWPEHGLSRDPCQYIPHPIWLGIGSVTSTLSHRALTHPRSDSAPTLPLFPYRLWSNVTQNCYYPVLMLIPAALPSRCPPATPCSASPKNERGISTGRLQNTVPSLSISIGGPPVSGRFCFAISRPPFHVALSRIWVKVSGTSEAAATFCRIREAIRSLTSHQTSEGLHRLTQKWETPACWRGQRVHP